LGNTLSTIVADFRNILAADVIREDDRKLFESEILIKAEKECKVQAAKHGCDVVLR
jgi:hypothetical protein